MYIKFVLCTVTILRVHSEGEKPRNEWSHKEEACLGLLCFVYPNFLSETFYKMLIWTE